MLVNPPVSALLPGSLSLQEYQQYILFQAVDDDLRDWHLLSPDA